MFRHRRTGRSAVLLTALLVATLLPSPAGAQDLEQATPGEGATDKTGLEDGRLRAAVQLLATGKSAASVADVVAGQVTVDVVPAGGDAAVGARIRALGGSVLGGVPGRIVLARVPFGRLAELEADPLVRDLRTPRRVDSPNSASADQASPAATADAPIVGAEVARTNADDWHAAGIDGSGVKIGIIDFHFDQAKWNASQAQGDLPAPAGTFCRAAGVNCGASVWQAGRTHGVGVAEIVHEMAPGATLYLGYAQNTSDLSSIVTSMANAGVRIITRSITSQFDGPGDGTGDIASVIDSAVAKGITWFNSVGNNGGTSTEWGSYMRRTWTDADADGFLEFATGDEILAFDCGFINGLRWSDWGEAGITDYDAYVYDHYAAGPGLTGPLYDAEDVQDGATDDALELFSYSCTADERDYLVIKRYTAGSGTSGDVLEFMTNGTGVEHWTNARSAGQPAADSKNPGMLAVGALQPVSSGVLWGHSSRGPTNDGRMKPELTAGTCVTTRSAGSCFNGSSGATPVAAGAAALLRDAGLATSPISIRTYLMSHAVDRGSAGPDNNYGAGELILPAPSLAFDLSIGSECAAGTSPGSPVTVSLYDGAGGLVDRVRASTTASGKWSVCFHHSHKVVPGFKIRATAGSLTRLITVPNLSLKTDRDADALRGDGPAGKTLSIRVDRYSGFAQADYPAGVAAPATTSTTTATVGASGTWTRNLAFDLVGGDFVSLTYDSGPDLFRVVEWAEFAMVHIGSSGLHLTMNTGSFAKLDLRRSGALLATAFFATGYFSYLAHSDFVGVSGNGRLVAAQAGDEVMAATTGFKTGFRIPSLALAVVPSTDVVSGSCGVAAARKYMLQVDTASGTKLMFGTTAANGTFSTDVTGTVNISTGDHVELTCKYPDSTVNAYDSAGDRVSRATTAP